MKMETQIKPNKSCNTIPFVNRPIKPEDRRSSRQPRKTEGPKRTGKLAWR